MTPYLIEQITKVYDIGLAEEEPEVLISSEDSLTFKIKTNKGEFNIIQHFKEPSNEIIATSLLIDGSYYSVSPYTKEEDEILHNIQEIMDEQNKQLDQAQEAIRLEETRKKRCAIRASIKLIGLLIAIDQILKFLVISWLHNEPQKVIDIFYGLSFVYLWNKGISFGLFKEYYQYANYFFIILNSIICFMFAFMQLRDLNEKKMFYSSFILGGAISNILDRILNGAVFDFIFIYFDHYYFPVFNPADAFIFLGVVMYIFNEFEQKKTI
jgi:signal peptidase II